MLKMPKNLVILGPQGSGKGTQAKLLAKEFGYFHISAGDALREIAKTPTKLGSKVVETINVKGDLVDPYLIVEVIKEHIKSASPNQPIIVDGYPRTVEQYGIMQEFWPKLKRGDFLVIFLELSEEESVSRLGNRYVCNKCAEIYTGFRDKCDKCGGRVSQRDDDNPDAVRERLKIFNSKTMPMILQMEKDTGRVVRIDGSRSIKSVHETIRGKLGL